MKSQTMHFIRGGQIFDFSMRMMIQVFNRILIWTVLGYLFFIGCILYVTAHKEVYLLAIKLYSQILSFVGKEQAIVWHSNNQFLTAKMLLNSSEIANAISNAKTILWVKAQKSFIYGGFFYFFVAWAFYYFFKKKGENLSQDKYISGTRLAKKPKQTIKSLKKSSRGISDIKLLDVLPMPKYSEKQGIFYHGSTGAGKTQAMMLLLEQIRAAGEPAIIYDKECTIKPYFFDEEIDVELNPISKTCANWNLWEECENPLELGTLATYLIPKSVQGSDPFWVDAARTILTSMAWKIKDRQDKSAILLLQLLLTTSLDEMRGLLEGTESENLVSREIEKTAISIKSVLATYTKSLRFLEGLDKCSQEKFSIKKWIKNACEEKASKKGWLFITSRSKYHKEIKPLISLWLGLAMQGIQSLNPDKNRKIWVVMDELASLHRLEMLSDTLADIRKFGGCVAIGIQSIAQLDFLYGAHESSAIADLLNSSVYFRSPKSKVAKWVSEDLGEQIIQEVRESQSYGPDSVRDGNTVGTQRTIRKTVEPGDIMTLEDLECYVRLIGNHPITRLKSKYIHRKIKCEALIERSINFDALEKINQAAFKIQNNPDVNSEIKKIRNFEEKANLIDKNEDLFSYDGEINHTASQHHNIHDPQNIESTQTSADIKEIF